MDEPGGTTIVALILIAILATKYIFGPLSLIFVLLSSLGVISRWWLLLFGTISLASAFLWIVDK